MTLSKDNLVKSIIEKEKKLREFNNKIKQLEIECGISEIRDAQKKEIEELSLRTSSDNQVTYDFRDHSVDATITIGKVIPKNDVVKHNSTIIYLRRMLDQKRLTKANFENMVTFGKGFKKRTTKLEMHKR